MHDLTMHELDAELAEQLPARELMQVAVANNNTAAAANFAANVAVLSNNVDQDITQTATAIAGIAVAG